MKNSLLFSLVFIVLLSLTGCGQTGPLYLPTHPVVHSAAVTTQVTPNCDITQTTVSTEQFDGGCRAT